VEEKMKRSLVVLSLILCLSFPALAGHSLPGGFYCDCNDPIHANASMTIENGEEIQQDEAPNYEESELDLMIEALLILISF
jgi:hypothetical protein